MSLWRAVNFGVFLLVCCGIFAAMVLFNLGYITFDQQKTAAVFGLMAAFVHIVIELYLRSGHRVQSEKKVPRGFEIVIPRGKRR